MRRRDAIKTIGAIAGSATASKLLAGCGGPDKGPTGITTIVVLCMENRSYDHYLGARTLQGLGGDGLTDGMNNIDSELGAVGIFNDLDTCVFDPPHGWDSSHLQWNVGANDGFMQTFREKNGGAGQPPHPMGYFIREQIPVTWSLADHYAQCDRWFSSLMGPTWPNRLYLHSGQSGGLKNNELFGGSSFPWPSIHTQLSDAGVDWAYYFHDLPFAPLFDGIDIDRVQRIAQFFRHAEQGELPPVVWIEPNFSANDDHPPHHPLLGQQLIAAVYRALAQSPQWKNTLFVVTYDEHGGFFDHVSPPTTADERTSDGFGQLGFRVPTVVAGPYVKENHISSVVRDHTSVLKHIANMFDLEPLTERVAAAEDLSELLDTERLESAMPRSPVDIPGVEVKQSELDEACFAFAPGQPELEELADAGFFPPELDGRKYRRDDTYFIAEELDRLGGGRIIK